jgi:hypothetical protein
MKSKKKEGKEGFLVDKKDALKKEGKKDHHGACAYVWIYT